MAEQLAGFQFAKPFDVTNPVSTDKRYGKFNGSITTPFSSKAEALDLIKPALRYQGLQCVILNGASIGLYWWRDGVADEQLVLLQTDVDLSNYQQKEAGKGLSQENYSTVEKQKLSNVATGISLSFIAPVREYKDYFEYSTQISSITLDGASAFQYSFNNGASYNTVSLPLATPIIIPASTFVRWRVTFSSNTTLAGVYIKSL
jgi:hypothetical protein